MAVDAILFGSSGNIKKQETEVDKVTGGSWLDILPVILSTFFLNRICLLFIEMIVHLDIQVFLPIQSVPLDGTHLVAVRGLIH